MLVKALKINVYCRKVLLFCSFFFGGGGRVSHAHKHKMEDKVIWCDLLLVVVTAISVISHSQYYTKIRAKWYKL